jgi:hypothetical protein
MTTRNILARSGGVDFDAEVPGTISVRHSMLGFAIEKDAEVEDRRGQAGKSRRTGRLID